MRTSFFFSLPLRVYVSDMAYRGCQPSALAQHVKGGTWVSMEVIFAEATVAFILPQCLRVALLLVRHA